MEKEIDKFKDTAMVVIKSKPKTKLETLLSNSPENIFVSAFSNYTHYDLYINGIKVNREFINPYGDHIFDAETYKEITEETMKAFLYRRDLFKNVL